MSGSIELDPSELEQDRSFFVECREDLVPTGASPLRRTFCAFVSTCNGDRQHDLSLFLACARRYGQHEVRAVVESAGDAPSRVLVIHPSETEWRLARKDEWTETVPFLFLFGNDESDPRVQSAIKAAEAADAKGIVRYKGNHLSQNTVYLRNSWTYPERSVLLYCVGNASTKRVFTRQNVVRMAAGPASGPLNAVGTYNTLLFKNPPSANDAAAKEAAYVNVLVHFGETIENFPDRFAAGDNSGVTYYHG